MATDTRLDAAAAWAEISEYDGVMRELIENSRTIVATLAAIPNVVADSVAEITLPELPSWMRWRVRLLSAKVADNGSAGDTIIALAKAEAPTVDLGTVTLPNAGTNDTYVDSTVNADTLYAGLSRFVLNVNEVATAASETFTARAYFEAVASAALRGDNWELPA